MISMIIASIKNSFSRPGYMVFISFLCLFGLYLVILWPGLFMADTFANYYDARTFFLGSWGSPLYDLYLISLLKVNSSPATLAISQVLFASIIISWFTNYALREYIPFVFLLPLYAVLAWPTNALQVVFSTRDFWAGWAHLFLALIIFKIYSDHNHHKKSPDKFLSRSTMILIILVSLIRKENFFIFLIACPILVYIDHRKKQLLFYFSCAFFTFIIFPYFTDSSHKDLFIGSKNYHLVSLVNPLSYILKKNPQIELSESDRKTLGKIISFDQLILHQGDLSVNPYIKRDKSKIYSDENFKDYKRLSYRIFWENLSLFLQNRFIVFKATIGLDRDTFYFRDMAFNQSHPTVLRVKAAFPEDFTYERKFDKLASALQTFHGKIRKNKLIRFTLSSALLSLSLCILTILFIVKIPATAIATSIILIRIPFIFLTEPVNQFKYIYSLYLFGFFIPYLILIENRARSIDKQVDATK